MDRKLRYTPVSIFAAGCGTIATAAAATNPATAPFALGIGTAASAVVGGIELNDEEKNIKENLDKAMDSAWDTIEKVYRLTYYSDDCISELKKEIMGENTSIDEFVRNIQSKGLEPSISLVIQNILRKYKAILNRDPVILWSDEYSENAAKEMASILVDAIKSVLEKDDHLIILRAIAESEERIINRIEDKGDQVIEEVQKIKPSLDDIKNQFSSILNDSLKEKNSTITKSDSADSEKPSKKGVYYYAAIAGIISAIVGVFALFKPSYTSQVGDEKSELLSMNIESYTGAIEEASRKNIVFKHYDDYDGDGKNEMFAIVEDKDEYLEYDFLIAGNLWFVNQFGVKELSSETMVFYEDPQTALLNNKAFLILNRYFHLGTRTYLWGVLDGEPFEYSISQEVKGMFLNDYNEFQIKGNDVGTAWYHKDTGSGGGFTETSYYLYYDGNTFREYGGILITWDEMCRAPGIKEVADKIQKEELLKGAVLGDIYYRGNDTISINISKEYEQDDLVFNSNATIRLWKGEAIFDGFTSGTSKKAYLENIATYPQEYPY